MNSLRRLLTMKLDVWEAALCALFLALAAHMITRPEASDVQSAAEIDYFRSKYGPHHNSEREEEWLIRDFFQDRRGGVFVDIGANHYQADSKTYYLETVLGWSGIAVEPQREFAAGYAAHRPNTRFRSFFVSSVSDEKAKLYLVGGNSVVASGDPAFASRFGTISEVREVPTVSLTDLLTRERVSQLDLLTIDIELNEPKALEGFDIDRFRPSLVCIEALLPVRQRILDYFTRHGYVAVGKYLWVDRENLYFTPLDSEPSTGATPVAR
jgi:FkbM family methyltransferase